MIHSIGRDICRKISYSSGMKLFVSILLLFLIFQPCLTAAKNLQVRLDSVTAGRSRLIVQTDQGEFFVSDDGGENQLLMVKYFLDLIDRKRLVTIEVDDHRYIQKLNHVLIGQVLEKRKQSGKVTLEPISGAVMTVLIADYCFDRGLITLETNFGKMIAEKGLTEFEPEDEVTLAHAMLTRQPVCLEISDGRILKFTRCQNREP